MVCRSAAFHRTLPDGTRVRPEHPRIAFDFAIINALGPSHWQETWMESRSAVEKYAEKKRSHLDTARKCNEVGIVFQPIVFDVQGGYDDGGQFCDSSIGKDAGPGGEPTAR